MNEQAPTIEKESAPAVDLEEIKMLMNMARKRGEDEFVEKQKKFLAKVEVDHPDFRKWRVYHAFTHSSIHEEDEKDAIDGDFPGKDSVLLFLQKYLGLS